MTDFAMPQALELEGSRRTGIPAIRREVVHNTTTQNEYRPSELCYIPLDTGAAGAFTDVSTTRLEMTVVVRNKNYFIDFINLPRCGWHSLIQEFGIEINNGIHELNRHYAECVELEMIKMGQNRIPFEFTRPNPWSPAKGEAGKLHINFIKPSMVTAQGLPHNVQYPSLTTLTSATTPDTITQSMLLHSNPFIHETLGTNLSFADATWVDPNSTEARNAKDVSWFVPSSFSLAQAYYDDRLISYQDNLSAMTFSSTSIDTTDYRKSAYDPTTHGEHRMIPDSYGESTTVMSAPYRVYGLPHGGNLLAYYSKNNPDWGSSTNIYMVKYGQSVPSYPPSMWPAKQPCCYEHLQKSLDESFRLTNADSIMNYYANCKNIPVGIPLSLATNNSDGEQEIWGDKIHTAPVIESPSVGAETEFHIVLKLYSSLIGELAKKWFPELVVPQGRMRVRLRFQEPQIVFQTLMDPCRRVPGTSRDWFPNLGITNTSDSNGLRPISEIDQCLPKYITSGVHPIMVSPYIPGDVYIDAIALGKYPIPMMRVKMLHDVFSSYDVANAPMVTESNALSYLGGATKDNYPRFGFDNYSQLPVNATIPAPANPSPYDPNIDYGTYKHNGMGVSMFIQPVGPECSNATSSTVAFNAVNALSMYHFELKKNQEWGFPIFRYPNGAGFPTPEAFPPTGEHVKYDNKLAQPTKISEYYNYTFPENWALRWYRGFIPATTESVTNTTSGNYDSYRAPIWYSQFDNQLDSNGNVIPYKPKMQTDPYHDWMTKTANWNPFCYPTPQYLPILNPSDKRQSRSLVQSDFVNENQTCFGTFLERSVAQVRRTHTQLYPLQIPDSVSSRIDERLTYIIRNVQIVTQQIVLPRTAALSIVENALNGGISMETRAWKEMESMLPRQETQKALINMAAAFCTDITFLFRPVDTFQGDRAYGYNSFSFYNPFTSFRFEFSNTLTPGATSERDYNYLGGRPIYYNECIIQQRTAFDIQLQLSSELLPRQPIDSIRRLIQHIRWGDQVFSDRDYMQLDPHLHPSYGSQKGMAINTLQDGFWACYVPISALDDQTITCNPFFTATEITLKKRLRGVRAPISALPIYKPFDGTFHLSFNLEAFMGQNERIRTGVPIVNNNMFLKMDKAHLLRDYDTQLLTVCSCDARVVFERGGTMQFFT